MSTGPDQSGPMGPQVTDLNQAVDERTKRQRQVEEMMTLSPEELAIMKECQRESLYLRALPMAAGAMVAAQMLVRGGRWKGHEKFGAWPKTILAGGFGYFFGKLTYVKTCQDKILEKIPDSNIARRIREQRNPKATTEQGPAFEYEQPSTRKQDDDGYKTAEGLDERFRPTMDNEMKEKELSPEQKKTLTYEDLRRRNRQEHEDNLNKRSNDPPKSNEGGSYKDSPFMPQKPWPDHPAKPPNDDFNKPRAPAPVQPRKGRTNMWGDPIDE